MVVVYDIETCLSVFTYSDINIETEEINQFVIHKDKDQFSELYNYLLKVKGQIGFNNLFFDYPIIHYILENKFNWEISTTENIIEWIYSKAQEIIREQNEEDFKNRSYIKEKDYKIQQLDLFKIWHYDNLARSTSLKALEISMNYYNVMECDIPFDKEDITLEEVESILKYNLNDVLATYEFYKKSKDKINLRKNIKKQYNLPVRNWNNGKIGEQLILKLYCDKTGLNPWDVKKLRTYRNNISLKECVPSNIIFKTKEFKGLLEFFNTTIVTQTKGSVDYSFIYRGIKYIYGTGGIHAAIYAGIYESNDKYIIKSLDVASLYPSLPIVYRFYIKHLGEDFLDVYENSIVKVRLAEKAKGKLGNKAIIDGFKEAANIPYGKSNDINSFLYDPLYTLKTTIAGQLVISMLCEKLCESISDSQMLMVNTDGCEIRIPREYEYIYDDICKRWEKYTGLVLEFTNYNKMIIGDINNYSAIDINSKIKNKGRFEFNKVIGNEPAYHKDNSFRIIPFAINNFFFNNIPIEETIMECRNIYDFCGRQKFKGGDRGETHKLEFDNFNNPFDKLQVQQKNVRYYISINGQRFIKKYKKGNSEIIHKGYEVTIFNEYIEKDWKDYKINYQYYISEAYKEINNIIKTQYKLF